MLASPFAFFRGAALIMAADLAAGEHTGLTAQLCGDAHLSNFGLFASPERNLVFDLTDFDLPGRGNGTSSGCWQVWQSPVAPTASTTVTASGWYVRAPRRTGIGCKR